MPDVYRVVAEHRAALLRGEDSARSAVARAYQEAIAAMLRDIERAAARTDARGYELLRVLMAEMETAARHLERVAGPMAGTIARAQSAAVIAASGDAESIVRFLATAGDTPYRRWHDPQAAQNIVGALADGSPLESALRERLAGKGLFGPSVLSQAKDALTTAVLRGMGAREAARTLRPVLRSGQWVAERIARTETIRAYREASRQSYLENADVVSGWRWVAAHSARTCAACLGMDGRVFPSTVPFGSHPACRCVSVPVVIGAEHLTTDRPTGEQWLQQQDADTQEEVLGARGRAMWASGAVGLSDFVHESYSPQWGVTRTARTPKERTAPALNLAA